VRHGPARLRGRARTLLETLVILAGIGVVLFWVIPGQTRGGGLGLSPGFLPTVCAIGIGLMIALDGVARLLPGTPVRRYPVGWGALLAAGGIAAAGAVALDFGGAVACVLLTVPAGFLILGGGAGR
jgi:hypothetical protein